MTTQSSDNKQCPAQELLKSLAGKWKPQLFQLATEGPLRFNAVLKQLAGINKQSLALALKEMETDGLLAKSIISEKPLHIEYTLSAKGSQLIPIFIQLEDMLKGSPE